MRRRRLTAVLATTTTLLLTAAIALGATASQADGRVTTRAWAPLTSSPSPNFVEAKVATTPDGTQHVVWMVDNPDHTHNYEHTTISRTGAQGPVTKVLPSNWAMLTNSPDLAVGPDGSLRLAFQGSVDGSAQSPEFYSSRGIYSAVSATGGATWTVAREVLAKPTAGGATLAYAPDGTTIAGGGDTGGFHWHVGAIDEASVPTAKNLEFYDQGAMAASLVSSGGSVLVVYQDNRTNAIYARQIWPTLGAPVRAPGDHAIPGQPIAVVERPGVGPVAALVVDTKVVLWDILANRTYSVRGMNGPNNIALAALPDGHLWVAAQGPIGYTPRASRVSARGWDIDRRPTMLDDLYSTFGVDVTSTSPLRAEVLVSGNESAEPTRLHAQSVEAQMSVKASPRRWRVRRAQRVAFKVTDVDGAVAGAKVRAAGKRCTTNSRGKCKITFRPVNRPRKIRVKVTKDSYVTATETLKIRR